MSNNTPNGNRIRGPGSALTSYLASNRISASSIRDNARARAAAAAAQNGSNNSTNSPSTQNVSADANQDEDNEDSNEVVSTATRRAQNLKRKKQREAIEKIKQSKAFKKRKHGQDSDDDLAWEMLNEKHPALPGQMANCETCGKRFTVTAYSRAGPDGGLLCTPCGKKLSQDEDANRKKPKRGPAARGGGGGRRKLQSRLLDGHVGAKSLLTLCIETLAKNIDEAYSLGVQHPRIIDRIARMLSKRRLIDSQTLQLFLQPDHNVIKVYDSAKLASDDFMKIFQIVTKLKTLKLRNAIQFTDPVMEYLVTRDIEIENLSISGSNLLSEDSWTEYLKAKGHCLKSLQIYYTDKHVGNDFMRIIKETCPTLESLKIRHNQQVSDEGVVHIKDISNLRLLSLELNNKTTTGPYVKVIESIGKQLKSFSIRQTTHVDDNLLDAIHGHCRSLTKLRITGSEFMTDAGFARLFRGWKNNALTFIDLEKCRHVDSDKPRENEHNVGLCSKGFEALMEHSGTELRHLNVHACRHISRETFEKVFAEDKSYPKLRNLEISFCEEVTDFVVGSIFRSCPELKELNVFGCMKVKDVKVPRGKILVGVPNAIGMRKEGDDDDE
ncbi:RNI-like protein [Xylariaceae sp. FL0255]|nr:RNI-like protein [Xylariaceae sp. FL0255]